jgi:hypothetical protein
MFCCRRFTKRVADNFKQIQEDAIYFKQEITTLKEEVQELKERQLRTKKNLVKMIDMFTLNEYVLFKTRLLTKKQTETLLEKIYDHYEYPAEFRNEGAADRLSRLMNSSEKPDGYDKELTFKNYRLLVAIEELKGVLDKLEESKLKDGNYEDRKGTWLGHENYAFTEVVIKCLKMI